MKIEKRAVALMEIIVVLVVIGILAVIAIPGFQGMRTRAELREIKTYCDMAGAAVKYYGAKHNNDFTAFSGKTQDQMWQLLGFKGQPKPPESKCTYAINRTYAASGYNTGYDLDGDGTIDKAYLKLDIYYKGQLICWFWPNFGGSVITWAHHPDERYLPKDLFPRYVGSG